MRKVVVVAALTVALVMGIFSRSAHAESRYAVTTEDGSALIPRAEAAIEDFARRTLKKPMRVRSISGCGVKSLPVTSYLDPSGGMTYQFTVCEGETGPIRKDTIVCTETQCWDSDGAKRGPRTATPLSQRIAFAMGPFYPINRWLRDAAENLTGTVEAGPSKTIYRFEGYETDAPDHTYKARLEIGPTRLIWAIAENGGPWEVVHSMRKTSKRNIEIPR